MIRLEEIIWMQSNTNKNTDIFPFQNETSVDFVSIAFLVANLIYKFSLMCTVAGCQILNAIIRCLFVNFQFCDAADNRKSNAVSWRHLKRQQFVCQMDGTSNTEFRSRSVKRQCLGCQNSGNGPGAYIYNFIAIQIQFIVIRILTSPSDKECLCLLQK